VAGLTPVYVEWLDHHQPSGPAWWTLEQACAIRPCVNHTTGFLVHEDDTHLVVVSSVSPATEHDEAQYGAPFSIVASAVLKVVPLVQDRRKRK
jgi:hypothetical protein